MDIIYNIDPNKLDIFKSYLINKDNPNGIKRGGACLQHAVESHYQKNIMDIISEFSDVSTENKKLGGVAIAAIINTAQVLFGENIDVSFYANLPNDENGEFLYDIIKKTPLRINRIRRKTEKCPKTFIINENVDCLIQGERSFITVENAEALSLSLDELDNDFYKSDIVLISCPHWEREINNNLTSVLKKCKDEGAFTVISTAFNPIYANYSGKWTLGDSDEVFQYIDLLITDKEEAYVYSGANDLQNAKRFYHHKGVKIFVVTDGVNPVFYYSDGSIIQKQEGFISISEEIIKEKESGLLSCGDTVGCGDNFAGGVVASIALQMKRQESLDILKAIRLGNVCGAFATTYYGGVYPEKYPGEKKEKIKHYYNEL